MRLLDPPRGSPAAVEAAAAAAVEFAAAVLQNANGSSWAPNAAPAHDSCAWLAAAMAVQPKPPAWEGAGNKAIVGVSIAIVVVTPVAMFLLRNAPRFRRARSKSLATLMALGVTLVCLALASLLVLPTGRTCMGTAVLLIFGYSVMSAAYFLRTLHLLARSVFAANANALDLDLDAAMGGGGAGNPASSSLSTRTLGQQTPTNAPAAPTTTNEAESVAASAITTSSTTIRPSAASIAMLLVQLLVRGPAFQTTQTNIITSTPAVNSNDANARLSVLGITTKIHTQLEFLSNLAVLSDAKTLLVLGVVWFVPGAIGLFVLLGIAPIYRSACRDCPILLDGAVVALIVVILNSLGAARVLWLCRHVEEDFGILWELVVSAAVCGALMMAGWGLLLADANSTSTTPSPPWVWLIVCGGFAMWVVWVPVQAAIAVWEQRHYATIDPATTSAAGLTGDGKGGSDLGRGTFATNAVARSMPEMRSFLKNSAVLDAFEVFCTKRFVNDGLRFIVDVDMFKKLFPDKPQSWRRTKSTLLFNTYCKRGAPMEINVSSDQAADLATAFRAAAAKDNWRIDLFDEAEDEVAMLLQRDAWSEFVTRGLLAGVLASSPLSETRGTGPTKDVTPNSSSLSSSALAAAVAAGRSATKSARSLMPGAAPV